MMADVGQKREAASPPTACELGEHVDGGQHKHREQTAAAALRAVRVRMRVRVRAVPVLMCVR
ncbi:MAG: hypothetical protein H7Z38_21305 [Rubrivivax sp.]|nr:hypothetical protein [Pyrinomonadaceae bacterium]